MSVPIPGATPTGPLKGFRILDLTTVLFGPFGAQTLGDWGAEIIKAFPVTQRSDSIRPSFITSRTLKSLPLASKAKRTRAPLAWILKAESFWRKISMRR